MMQAGVATGLPEATSGLRPGSLRLALRLGYRDVERPLEPEERVDNYTEMQ